MDPQHFISIPLETTREPRNVKIQQCYMLHNMTKHLQNDNVNQIEKQEKINQTKMTRKPNHNPGTNITYDLTTPTHSPYRVYIFLSTNSS